MKRLFFKANGLVKSLLNSKHFKQAGLLFSVNILTVPIGIVTSIVVTRYLGAQLYGDYKFILTIFEFAIILLTFGIFQAGNRAIVTSSNPIKTRELYGALLLFLLILFVVVAIAVGLYALLDPNVNEKGLVKPILYVLPFSWAFLLVRYVEVLFQADNRIKLLATSRILPKLGFLLCASVIYFYFLGREDASILMVLFLYLGTQIIVYLLIIGKLKVSFANLKLRMKELIGFVKSYGFDVYLGSVIALGLIKVTGILISYYGADNSGVGYFSLAMTIAMPISLIPGTIATTHYKKFSTMDSVPSKLIFSTLGLSALALLGVWIIVGPFVSYFYGEEFEAVTNLTYIISCGFLFHGFGDFFNRFLGSNGQGKMLRNSSMIVGIVTLMLNVPLIYYFNETGGAFAQFGTGVTYFIAIYSYYFIFRKSRLNSQKH